MKKGGSTSYWDGELWDESGSKRVYGFDGGVRRKLWEFQEKGEAVDLASCVVKKAKCSDELEIMVPKSVVCCLSPEKINASVVMAVKNANVGEIGDLQLHKSFNICVEVLSVDDELTVGANLRKQDVVVADSTGSARLVLWEKEIGTKRVGDCYSVESVIVREFHGERYLSSQKQRTVFRDADPVEGVSKEEVPLLAARNSSMEKNMRVIGVSGLERYSGCFKCRRKLCFDDEGFAECSKCGVAQSCETAEPRMYIGDSKPGFL